MAPRYADKRTLALANGEFVPAFSGFRKTAERRLAYLESAASLEDIRAIPAHKLHKLHGDREGQWAVWVNDQYRICFDWDDTEHKAINIEIVDYH